MSQERHLTLSHSGITDINSGLAWVVQAFDREFSGAQFVKIAVEQSMVSETGEEGTWEPQWTASISGLVEETP